ncbi:MAG: erythromycin esterase family protein [Flavobacteriales bacterium]
MVTWLSERAVTSATGELEASRIAAVLAPFHVIGLGEATHGQHEAFDLKRRVTMALIRTHGVRTVAYEASASMARACDDYIQGRTNDRLVAMNGFGMLIWDIEENAALLDDLRAWNMSASPADRVRFIRFDAQDGGAVADRIKELVSDSVLVGRVRAIVERVEPAIHQLFQGDRTAHTALVIDLAELERDLSTTKAVKPQDLDELRLRALELRAFVTMYASPGGRDQMMADLLMAQLGPNERCVAWAHNGHLKRSALDYLGTEELAMGGHLARALNKNYYALGFTFGSGGFQANAPDSTGRWGFKRYAHSAPATGSLEAELASTGLADLFVDLRSAPADSSTQHWLHSGHGHRWWGGYQVPDDCDERTRDASQLMQMTPAKDYDGLVFLLRTTPAEPVDKSRIIGRTR